MSDRIKLALLYGGKSGEHEISLISAASVLAHLDPRRYQIMPIGMDKNGCFYENNYEELLQFPKSLPVSTPHSTVLSSLIDNGRLAVDAQVVFPVVHGPLYEDGCLQGLLELAGIAYVGCDVLASAIGMDKDIARQLVCKNGIQSARYRVLSGFADATETALFCQNTAKDLGWPLFVKPCSLGSSVGIHKTQSLEELKDAVADARRYDKEVLVESFILGREIELAVLENQNFSQPPLVSVPGEIEVHHSDGFYSYTAKYLESGQTQLCIPADLSPSLIVKLQKMASDIFVGIKARGMARVDFFVEEGTQEIYFNEINTLPGFTSISMYPKLWEASGLKYTDLLDQLIQLALEHQRCQQNLVTHYQ